MYSKIQQEFPITCHMYKVVKCLSSQPGAHVWPMVCWNSLLISYLLGTPVWSYKILNSSPDKTKYSLSDQQLAKLHQLPDTLILFCMWLFLKPSLCSHDQQLSKALPARYSSADISWLISWKWDLPTWLAAVNSVTSQVLLTCDLPTWQAAAKRVTSQVLPSGLLLIWTNLLTMWSAYLTSTHQER